MAVPDPPQEEQNEGKGTDNTIPETIQITVSVKTLPSSDTQITTQAGEGNISVTLSL